MDESSDTDASQALLGQVNLVTGGGRGLGRAFAERLAALGGAVVVHGHREHGPAEYEEGPTLTETTAAIAAAHGVEAVPVLGSLQHPEEVERVGGESTARFGRLNVLVHNAGGDIAAADGKPDSNDVVNISPKDVRAVLDSNLLTAIFTCQQAARVMTDQRSRRIVTLGPVAGSIRRSNASIYATSKAAVAHFTRCLAAQMRPYNVTANCIDPGDTRTGRFLCTRELDEKRMVESGTLEQTALVGVGRRGLRRPPGHLRDRSGHPRRRQRPAVAGVYVLARHTQSLN